MNEAKKEMMIIAESCLGKTFYEINQLKDISEKGNKGALGQLIEMNVFGYELNSNSEKDLKDADMELKVTPYKRNKNGTYSAKERLVLNIINYKNEYKKTFYTSSFWIKNSNILVLLYEHKDGLDRKDFKVTHVYDMEYDENELIIIKQDFEIIKKKILDGKAHELSEGDTMYLGACTKGATAQSSYREQPFSTILAKQRAYSLKTTFMTQKVREIISSEKYESIYLDEDLQNKLSFEQMIISRVKPYYGKTEDELRTRFGVHGNSKNIYEILFGKMLGIKGKLSKVDEFVKAGIVPKFIRLKSNGKITESMSFPAFKFKEVYEHEFEDSEIYEYFTTKKFLFVVFEYNANGQLFFSHIKLWNIPMIIIENELSKVYNYTKDIISKGKIVKFVNNNGVRITNFPDKKYNRFIHVRPHARNGYDTYELPVEDQITKDKKFTKQCFWLNNNYVSEILSDYE